MQGRMYIWQLQEAGQFKIWLWENLERVYPAPLPSADVCQPASCGECCQDVILRQTPMIFTKSWGAATIAPPLAILCLVPAWFQGP
eukprot:131904-Chlamydomonas_euryale.AAC.3